MRVRGDKIWDRARKAWVALTPEERVRAWFLDFMIDTLSVAEVRIATEFTVRVGGRSLRADVIITQAGSTDILAVVECKAPDVNIDQTVFSQAGIYGSVLGAQYIIVTNSRQTYGYDIHEKRFIEGLAFLR